MRVTDHPTAYYLPFPDHKAASKPSLTIPIRTKAERVYERAAQSVPEGKTHGGRSITRFRAQRIDETLEMHARTSMLRSAIPMAPTHPPKAPRKPTGEKPSFFKL